MMTGRGAMTGTAGGPARHIPVALAEVLAALSPRDGGIYVDGTFGAGGYSNAILATADCRVIAIDRDPAALAAGSDLVAAHEGRLSLVEGRFADLGRIAEAADAVPADGIVLDIGVSSMQLDDGARGFSFRADGPLDMRMGGEGPSAAEIVNGAEEKTLGEIIAVYGEERRARAIAKAIVRAREIEPIRTTDALVRIVERVLGPKREGQIHPATRTFQALRIHVNGELEELGRALGAAEQVLAAGGRLVVVTFHSLEDRIVKSFLNARAGRLPNTSRHLPEPDALAPSFALLTRKAVMPGDAEIAVNPRARSAKLRAAERTLHPAHAMDLASIGVPHLASTADETRRQQKWARS